MNSGTIEETQFHSSKLGGNDGANLEADLGALDGVRSVQVDADDHLITVVYDSAVVDANAVRGRIEAAGFNIDEHADEVPPASEENADYNV